MELVVRSRPAAAQAPAARIAAAAVAIPLFGAAMFVSGFLLFLVEPMVARMVLPILGGVPMVWNGCVAFFQMTMLAGYGYAFAASRRLPVRGHVALHAVLLASPALVLPVLIRPASATPPSGHPLPWLLRAAGRHHRPAVLRAVDDGVGAAALAVAYGSSSRARSLFPLCGEQRRLPAGAGGLSARDRAVAAAGRTGANVGDRLRGVRAACRGVRRIRVASRAGRSGTGRRRCGVIVTSGSRGALSGQRWRSYRRA